MASYGVFQLSVKAFYHSVCLRMICCRFPVDLVSCVSYLKRSASNCWPVVILWSVVILCGTLNFVTQSRKKCFAIVSAVISDTGVASGQRVKRSIIVNIESF